MKIHVWDAKSKIITLKDLIAHLEKKEDLRDFLLGLSVYTNGVIELHVP